MMVFGRRETPDPQLGSQRQRLAALQQRLEGLEQAVGRLKSYREGIFADVWFDSPDVADAVLKIGQARSLLDDAKARAAVATRAVLGLDSELGMLAQVLEAKARTLDVFSALLVGRLHLWRDPGRDAAAPFSPSVRACQEALYGSGAQLAGAFQQHLRELADIKARHQGPWPPKLDLANLQMHVDDALKALKIYGDGLAIQSEPLPQETSVTLLMIAQTMESGVEMIEGERANLALDTITRSALRGS
jgi:hypothetical protein